MSPEKQRDTFLSYSRINKDFALQLARELKSAGFSVWIDQLDIPTGARWDDELEKALDECEIFMVILTPASIASDNVKDEIGYAIDTDKRILPILLENAKIPLRLRRFQYVDFTGKTYAEGVEGAKQQLRKLIDEPTNPRPQLSPAEQAQKAESDRLKKEKIVAHKVETARKAEKVAGPKVAPAPAISETPKPATSPPVMNEPVAQPAPAVVQPVSQPVPTMSASMPSPSQPVQKKVLSKPLMIGLGIGALVIVFVSVIIGLSLSNESEDTTPIAAEVAAEEPGAISKQDAPALTVTSVYYDSGEFVQISQEEWRETNYEYGDEYYFWEEDRDEWSVYLYDESRDVYVRLDLWTQEVLADENDGQGEYVIYPIVEFAQE